MLRYFEERFLNGKQPSQMIMDDSAALALASIRAYTPYKSMLEYHDACFDALFEGSTPPRLELKLDRSHFVKSIVKSKALQNEKEKGKRKFYQRILGFIMLSDKISEVQAVIKNMFILLKNEYLHSEQVIKARDELKAIAKSHKHVLEENSPENYVEMHDIEEDRTLNSKCKSKFYKWVHRIAKEVDGQFVNHALNASTEETNAERNPYFSKVLEKPLIKILSRVHLFSFVMNSTFGSEIVAPSSSCTEAQYRNINSYIFKHRRGLRLDSWLERSIEVTTGNFKALVAEANEANKPKKTTKSRKKVITKQHNDESTEVLCESQQANNKTKKRQRDDYRPIEENWKDQNVDAKATDLRHVPARTFRSQNSILNTQPNSFDPIPMLMNGGKSKRIDDIPVIYSTQTCAFDSIFQLCAACYADSARFKDEINKSESSFAKFLKLTMTADEEDQIDTMRNFLLTQLYPERITDMQQMQLIDIETVITDMYERLCVDCPILDSEVTAQSCDCDVFTGSHFVRFKLSGADVKNLQKTLLKPKSKKRCEFCRFFLVDVTLIPQEIVAFDTSGAAIRNVALNDFQREIVVENFRYRLLGTVEHQAKRKHFVPHVLRGYEWIAYDDLNPRPSKSPHTIENSVLILYRLVL